MTAAGTRRVIATHAPTRTRPDPKDIQAESAFQPKADIPAHGVRVQVHGGPNANGPLGGHADPPRARIRTRRQDHPSSRPCPRAASSIIDEATAEPLVAIATINGKEITSQPFDVTKKGGLLDFEAHWDTQGKLEAMFDSADIKPDRSCSPRPRCASRRTARCRSSRSPSHGTKATLYIYPRILFSFSWTAQIDDEYLAVGGQFDVTNYSWAPYVGGNDGLVIPLPAHFKGARVDEQDQDDVAVAQGEGFRIVPADPAGRQAVPRRSSRCPSRTAASTGSSTCRSARSRAAWRSARRRA